MSQLTETVFVGYDNVFKLEVREDNILVDFTSATRFVLEMNSNENIVQIDTDIDSGAIVGDANGILIFDLGGIISSDKKGFYRTNLQVYDPSHPDGQILISNNSTEYPDLNINVC